MRSLLTDLGDSSVPRSKSARKIAAFVLRAPETVVDMPIASLAAKTGVSEPTVARFCTGLGLKGFPDFKLTLAAELARGEFRVAQDINIDDSCAAVIGKVFESAHASLQATLLGLDAGIVEQVVNSLSKARSILICGQGASSSVALDAQHKMLRFEVPVIVHPDNLNQRMSAAGLGAQDCLLCISYTGRTIPVIEIARMARTSGARVIGLTAEGSPLARECDAVLPVASSENTDVYIPMSSRLAQLAVIDVITTRLAMRQGKDFPQRIKAIKQSQLATKLGKERGR